MEKKDIKKNYQKGQSLIEVIVAIAIFSLISAVITTLVLGSLSASEQGGEQTQAAVIAQEGMEAVRSIYNRSWENLSYSQSDVSISSGQWVFDGEGSSDTIGQYTRTITFSNACRNASGDIADCPSATVDENTKKVISEVDWTIREGVTNSVRRTCYFMNSEDSSPVSCDWSSIVILSSIDLSGNQNGMELQLSGDYIYYIRDGGFAEFIVIDVSDLENPNVVGSLELSGTPYNIVILGDYAFVASGDESEELQIIDILNPASPTQVGSYDAEKGADAYDLDVVGETVYLVRKSSKEDELLAIDVTSKSSPSLLGSLDLDTTANEIVVNGNYAFIATDDKSEELQIVNISNPSGMFIDNTYDFDGNEEAETLTLIDDILIIARDKGEVYLMDISNLNSPSVLGTYDAQEKVNDLAVSSNGDLYLGTNYNGGNLQIVDISDTANPIQKGIYDDNNDIDGIAISDDACVAFAALSDDNQEFIIFTPLPPDITPPLAVSDLSLSNATNNSIDLAWTAVGDDADTGTATAYDIRYSTSEITTLNWGSANEVIGEPTPSISGTLESMTVSELSPDTSYYFAIKTSDEVPNVSGLSNVPVLATTGGVIPTLQTIFNETFPNVDGAWNGSSDTTQDESGWGTIQGNGDNNDVQVSNEDRGASPSGGSHLTFEDADQGFYTPETYDIAYVSVDLSGYTGVTIEYYWQSDDVDPSEGMRVAYSTDSTNGVDGTWTQIAEYINPSDDNWIIENFDLPDAHAVSTFMLRFSSKSNKNNEHMYVDDITIQGYQ